MAWAGAAVPAALLGLATVAAVLAGNGSVAIAVAPFLLAVGAWAVWKAPLRVTLLLLLAAAWVLESPGDVFASGLVTTPWSMAGQLLWAKLNLTFPVPALMFSGFDVVALLLLAVVIHRRATRSRVDRGGGWVSTPRALGVFVWLSLGAVAWLSLYGIVRGGSLRFTLWQSIRFLYLPVVYFFMREALRGPRDLEALGKVVLSCGVVRAVEAIVLRQMYPSTYAMPHATVHHDSVLFAACVCILVALVLELPSRRTVALAALLLPVYLWGMLANNRRLAWAEVALVLAFFYLVLPWGPVKRRLTRLALVGAVPLLLYAAVGWRSQARIFAPVQKIRSIVDSQTDASTLWRDFENYDLVHTFRQRPLFGSGFGHPFIEVIRLPDVTAAYELEPYVPHNSVLGLWAFGGLAGFAALWFVFPAGIFFSMRAYHGSRDPRERAAALGAAAVQLCYLLQGYGDLGFGTAGPVFTTAASLALVGKICTANGAWKTRGGTARALPSR